MCSDKEPTDQPGPIDPKEGEVDPKRVKMIEQQGTY
jgi:hypothetical protein